MSDSEDVSGTVWRDDMWLSSYPLNYHTALDYFSCSPFWDPGCNNVRARLEQRPLAELHGVEYTLDSCQEPHLFVICKQLRKAADLAAPEMFFYILDGSVYQTPTIHAAFSARLNRCMYNVQRAFLRLQSDLDPLVKPIPTPSATSNMQTLAPQQQISSKRRLPNPDDIHATNRIISHVLRKNAFAANDQQQTSVLSSEPSDLHLPHVRANTPAASGVAS
ncbi:hypothetical protein ABBQ38_003550 [Trebouxia sp. C0009 RCD-2024]